MFMQWDMWSREIETVKRGFSEQYERTDLDSNANFLQVSDNLGINYYRSISIIYFKKMFR